MTVFQAFAIVISLTALFGYLNERYIRLPTPIGVTLMALVLSLGLLFFGGSDAVSWADRFLTGLNFDILVLEGMLSFLLFAGALHVNWDDLRRQQWTILVLATLGILSSTFLIGGILYLSLPLLGVSLPFIYALLFGALISPTDPIAVLGILRRLGVRKDVETLVVGESLFNDGVGVVVFLAILGLATAGPESSGLIAMLVLFIQEAAGGMLFGLALGLAGYYLLRDIDSYPVEVLITLALVAGGYALALELHTSGPLAMVMAGLLIGNQGRSFAMSAKTREHLDTFWELVDEMLNAVLFVLIGLELLVIFDSFNVTTALLAIPLVLLARSLSVGAVIALLRRWRSFPPWTVRTMVWGGLRGGISVALALSLPSGPERNLLLGMTYGVVVFAILVQGLTIGKVAERIPKRLQASGEG